MVISLLLVDVQTNLFIPVRKGLVPFGGGDNRCFAGRRWAELLGQIHFNGQDITFHFQFDVFHIQSFSPNDGAKTAPSLTLNPWKNPGGKVFKVSAVK